MSNNTSIEELEKRLEDQRRDYQLLHKQLEELSQSQSPGKHLDPSSHNPNLTSSIQYVQNVAEATPMTVDEDIEDYLGYFETVYDGLVLNESQKIIYLISKIPRHYSRFIQPFLKAKPSFDQLKKHLTDQFGTSKQERQRRFESMVFMEGQDVQQFILQAEQHLQYLELPESVVAYKIYEKLPFVVKQLIDVKSLSSVKILHEKARLIKSSNVLQLLTQSVQQLNLQPQNTSSIIPVYNAYGDYNTAHTNYSRPYKSKRNWKNKNQQKSVQHQDGQSGNQESKIEVEKALATHPIKCSYDQDKDVHAFCDLDKNDGKEEKEAFPIETRSGNVYGNNEGTSQCKQEEPDEPIQPEQGAEPQRRKKRHPYQREDLNQQTENNNPFSQRVIEEPIIFTQDQVCDRAGNVNLTGLIERMQIQLPLRAYLRLNNQEIVTIDPRAKPVNIYTAGLRDEVSTINVASASNGNRLSKIVVPVEINGKVLLGIVDTGAEYTLMSKAAARKAGVINKINTSTTDQVRGIAGISKVYGYLQSESLYIGSAKIRQDIAILDERNFEVLIGRDILLCQFQNMILDSSKSQIIFELNGKKYNITYDQAQVPVKSSKEVYLSDAIIENRTWKAWERVKETFKGYPVERKYNFFYGDLPYCYPLFHTSRVPYRTESVNKLKALPVKYQSMADSICLLWTQGPKIPQTLAIMKEWGFQYKTVLLVWVKCTKDFWAAIGLGYWTRSNTEMLLMGSKGSVAEFKSPQLNILQYLETTALKTIRKKHSQKPEEVYQILKKVFNVGLIKGLELFGSQRSQYNDFLDIYGDQMEGNFDQVSSEALDYELEKEVNDILYQNIIRKSSQTPVQDTKNCIASLAVYIKSLAKDVTIQQQQPKQEQIYPVKSSKNNSVDDQSILENFYNTFKFLEETDQDTLIGNCGSKQVTESQQECLQQAYSEIKKYDVSQETNLQKSQQIVQKANLQYQSKLQQPTYTSESLKQNFKVSKLKAKTAQFCIQQDLSKVYNQDLPSGGMLLPIQLFEEITRNKKVIDEDQSSTDFQQYNKKQGVVTMLGFSHKGNKEPVTQGKKRAERRKQQQRMNIFETVGQKQGNSEKYQGRIKSNPYILSSENVGEMSLEHFNSLNIPEMLKGNQAVKSLFSDYSNLFSFDGKFKATNVLKYRIDLKSGVRPIKQKQRMLPEIQKQFVAEQVKDLLEKDLVFEADSDWASPLVIVPKKGGKLKMCIDYRDLNEATVKVKYPSPFIWEIVQTIGSKKHFATLDLISGYWQVQMEESSIPLTAFTCFLGTFACRRLQFGLCNAVMVFQKMMEIALKPAIGRICFVYIDDIVVFAESVEELTANLREIFELLRKADLTLSPTKCEFYTSEVQILGQVIAEGHVKPQPAKLKTLEEFRSPKSIKEIQQFLGLINYFRNFIPSVAELTYPIQKLVSKNAKFDWGPIQQECFNCLKDIMKRNLTLYVPKKGAKMVVQVTVTAIAFGGILLQQVDQEMQPIQFVSKMLPEAQLRQTQELREIRAVVAVLEEWQHFLLGQPFLLETDVKSIQWALNNRLISKLNFVQSVFLSQFDFELRQRSPNQLKHLQALFALNKQLDWLNQMEDSIEAEAKQRIQEKELQKAVDRKVNPISQELLAEQDLIAYTDGACQGKKGDKVGNATFLIRDCEGKLITMETNLVESNVTNNVCEYMGLISLLEYLIKQRMFRKKILIVMDSQLVVNQVKRLNSVNDEVLRTLFKRSCRLLRYFKRIEVVHVPREFNQEADAECKRKLKLHIEAKKETECIMSILPIQMEAYNVTLRDEWDSVECTVCNQHEPATDIIFCDHCANAYHFRCAGLDEFPINDWYCQNCVTEVQALNRAGANTLDPAENENLRSYLANPQVFNNFNAQQQEEVRALARRFVLVEGKHLCYRTDFGLKRVPTVGQRALVVKQIHQSMGHFGCVKTVDMVRQAYWWPNMVGFIEGIVKKCLLCQANHAQYPQLRQSYAIIKGMQPFTHVVLDLFYLPETEYGFRYVALAIDSFTKWPEALPIFDRDSQTITEWFHREIVCRYGAPHVVRTDNGGEFMGAFHNYLMNQRILHVVGSPFYPQSQGQVERMVETIKNGIRKVFNSLEYRADWSFLLPQVLLGIRTSISRATKFSPSQLLMGRDLVLPRHQVAPSQSEYIPPTPDEIRQHFEAFVGAQEGYYNTVYQELAYMDKEIRRTIDRRRKRTPKDLDYEDTIVLKKEPANALEIDAEGPMVVMEYTDRDHNVIRYYNPRTRQFGKASVTNVKLINV